MDQARLKKYYNTRLFRVVLTLWVTYATYTMARRPFSVLRVKIEQDTGLTPTQSSLVDSAFMLTYTLGQLLYECMKRQCSNKAILLYGILVSAAACAFMAASSSFWAFCVAWAINGVAQSAGWSTSLSILNVWLFPHERGRVLGLWSTCMSAGGVFGNLVPSFLVEHDLTWRCSFLVEMIILVVVGLVVNMLLVQHPNIAGFLSVQQSEKGPEMIPHWWNAEARRVNMDGELFFGLPSLQTISGSKKPNEGNVNTPPTALPITSSSRSDNNYHGDSHHAAFTSWEAFRIPGVPSVCASYFLHKLVRYGFLFWFPYFAVHELHYTTERAGYVMSAFDIGGVVGTVTSGYCSDWLFQGRGRTQVILLFTAGMIFSTLFLGAYFHSFVENTMLCIISVATIGFFAFAIDALMTGSFLLDFLEYVSMETQVGSVSALVGGMGSAGSIFQGIFMAMLSPSSWSSLCHRFVLATALGGLCLLRPLYVQLRRGKAMASPP